MESNKLIKKIIKLQNENYSLEEISKLTGYNLTFINREIKKAKDNSTLLYNKKHEIIKFIDYMSCINPSDYCKEYDKLKAILIKNNQKIIGFIYFVSVVDKAKKDHISNNT